MGPGGPRGLQSRCEARRTSRVCSIHTHLRQLYCAVLANGAFCWLAAETHGIQKNEEGHTLPRFALRVLQLLEKLEFRFRHLAIQRREASGIDAHPCEHARCGIVFRIETHRHAATRRYRARGRNHGRVRMRGSKGGLRCHSRMRRLKRHNVGM